MLRDEFVIVWVGGWVFFSPLEIFLDSGGLFLERISITSRCQLALFSVRNSMMHSNQRIYLFRYVDTLSQQ